MRVGLVGCGIVGRRLGVRLLRAGHALRVHDVDREQATSLVDAGAQWEGDARSVAGNGDLIISALPCVDTVETVFAAEDGCWSAARPNTIHLETSTIGPDCARRLAAIAERRGLRYLDGAISRGGVTADGIELVLWIGGHADHYDLARPILETMCDRVRYCGGVGHAQVTKLVNNLVALSQVVVAGEALVLGVRHGVPLELLLEALQDGTAQSRVLGELLPRSVFIGDWQPGLALRLAERDLELARKLADESGVQLSTLETVQRLHREARERGWADLSSHAVVRLAEEAAGVELRSPILQALAKKARGRAAAEGSPQDDGDDESSD